MRQAWSFGSISALALSGLAQARVPDDEKLPTWMSIPLFAAISVYVFYKGVESYFDIREFQREPTLARRWSTAKAHIVRAETVPAPPENGGSAQVYADVLYAFRANGGEFTGNRFDFRRRHPMPPANAKRFLEDFKPGTEIDIWHDPARPTNNVIDRSMPPTIINGAWGMMAFGALFGVVTAVFAYYVLTG